MPAFDLSSIGWTDKRQEQLAQVGEDLAFGRVSRIDRGRVTLLTPDGSVFAVVPGRLRQTSIAVGDWVALARADESSFVVQDVLPRSSHFARGAAGTESSEQVLAANIDIVFIVAAVDAPINQRRLERYATLVWDGGATPQIVLNKVDLVGDTTEEFEAVQAVAPAIDVFLVSASTGLGLDDIRHQLESGITGAFVGPSGVGKSSLVNAILAEEHMQTAEVRQDMKGRHTTTHRELIPLPGGGAIVDSPGMRELGLFDGTEGLAQSFADIEELAGGCKFNDCTHTVEPGCAVLEAVGAGSLGRPRLDSYHKLQKELRFIMLRRDKRAAADETRKWRTLSRSLRNSPKK